VNLYLILQNDFRLKVNLFSNNFFFKNEISFLAVWAGWGHASENPKLPELLHRNGIVFIGNLSLFSCE
jgi:biotin carboxylase